MELSLALNVSAQLSSRLLARIEERPELASFADVRAAIERPADGLEQQIVNAKGWDDAVHRVEARGVERAAARAMVDWVILDMALDAYQHRATSPRALTELAAAVGVSVEEAARDGAAATLRRASGPNADRLGLTRAFVGAALITFSDAFPLGDALADPERLDTALRGAAEIDRGDAPAAATIWVGELGLAPHAAERLARAMVVAFRRPE